MKNDILRRTLCLLTALLFAALPSFGCVKESPTVTPEPTIEATSKPTAEAALPTDTPEPSPTPSGDELEYRFASMEEGKELLLSNEEYYAGFTQNDLDFKMQKSGATMEEYLAFAKEQVLDFSEEQKAIISRHMERINKKIADEGYHLPAIDEIVFVNTTMKEECGSMAYTHGTQIYIDGGAVELYGGRENENMLNYIFAHEVFHCLTRCSREFRSEMYRIIHFTTTDADFTLPPSVLEYFISNPDVEHHDAYATFIINGEPMDCFAAFVTTKHFEKEGDNFFYCSDTALVPIDGSDVYYLSADAENFYEVFGRNTDYVIDPEECMADNFGYLFAYGLEGYEDRYPNPEIIEAIEAYLKK